MLKIHNTASSALEPFVPLQAGKVSLYVCGPTVYDHAHIGHGRTYVAFDMLVRYLRFSGFVVTYARNITDIDDKIIKRAGESGTPFVEHAEKFAESFLADMDRLGLSRPDLSPKATESMDAIVAMIATLIEQEHAYEVQGDVYFRVQTAPNYGKLSKKNIEDLQAGARVAENISKENPLDFALWKAAKAGEPSWDSPWGKGRPGWHIECSAMINKYFAHTIDIHGGGRDLIFPHHENEMAQSECCNQTNFVKYWAHSGFVTMDKEKMSKSIGNTINLKQLFDIVHPEALKIYLLSAHYRSPIEFNDQDLQSAARGLDKIYRSMHALGEGEIQEDQDLQTYRRRFVEAMDEDFNTAKAIGVLYELVKAMNKLGVKADAVALARGYKKLLIELAQAIGLLQHEPLGYFMQIPGMQDIDVEKVEQLIAERMQARRSRDFARADEIRDQLTAMAIVVEDSPEGTTWRKK